MLSKKNLVFLFLAPGLLLFSSCSKNDVLTDSRDLVGVWAITGIYSNIAYDWDGDGYEENDIFSTYDYCDREITVNFDPNGYGEIQQGCDAPYENLYWNLSNNGQYLDMSIPSGDINLYLTQFDSRTIRGYDQVNINGRNVQITYTLTRLQ